ncbi:beta-propeller domain-containing protein [Mycoplasmatota bacterium]|nr:beta-propeller domain-containing protein [Mycoplasmatota bacterium]
MHGIVVLIIIGVLYILILKNKIKINFITLFLLALIGVSSVYLLTNIKKTNVTYVKMETPEQISEIWKNYSNQVLENDVQLTRTLNPYKVLDENLREPNQVITDDENIYSISGSKVVITQVKDLDVIHEITYIGQPFRPMFLYVTNEKLIVIGEAGKKTRGYIYNKGDYSEFKNFQMDATYITSRLINDELFIVSSKILDHKMKTKERPIYRYNGVTKYVPYSSIYYVKNTYPNNYVNIMKTNINKKDDPKIMSYLGLGQVLYFSPAHIYIAEERYAKDTGNSNKTILIKINNQNLNISGLQEVSGYVLDQYSLNEYKGNLRVATSTHDEKNTKESNHVYILNDDMKIVGRLENFSEGNEIQAAVFIKDKAYIETFNILDPFYVIDLKNEKKPKIINELKFEGYNTNFVPYDENHILAFGLVLNNNKQSIGLKVSLYDVEDPHKVTIISKDTIMYKDYNSAYTDVLYDCQSLLLDRDKNILGFPIVYWINEKGKEVAYYKQFYSIYHVDTKGLKKLGKISHYEKAMFNNVDDDIKRGLIINNKIYTVSDKLIKENSLNKLRLINEVHL